MKQPGFIRLATLALLSTLSFFSHGETILRLAYAENSQPVKMRCTSWGSKLKRKRAAISKYSTSRTDSLAASANWWS